MNNTPDEQQPEIDTREPNDVITAALHDWTPWQPGDGSRYLVRIVEISVGPDYSDRVLLINQVGSTAAFQYATADYRLRHWTRTRAQREGAAWAWPAARPLLETLGVAKVNP